MTNALITISKNIVNTRAELNLIGANARGLKGPGRELLPLKPDMLGLPDDQADVVMDTVELLFAAELKYVDAQIAEQRATDAVSIVAARVDRGQAEGTVTALIHGSTANLLYLACERAPIAMHAIFTACPELRIKDRLTERLS